MLKYWILITANARGTIVSSYSPDLKRELLENIEDEEVKIDFRSYAKKKLVEYLENRNKILFPIRFKRLEEVPLTPFQHWEFFKINPNKKRPLFEKMLPAAGHVFNVVGILTNLFITFMALKIASENNNSDNSTGSTILAIVGSIFNSLINFFLYVTSGATDALTEMGGRLDNLFRKSDTPVLEGANLRLSNKQVCKFFILSLTAGGCILTNSLIVAIRQYLENALLANKYLALSHDEEHFKLIKLLVILPNIIAVIYAATAFQGSFAKKLIERLTDKSEETVEENEMNLSESSILIRPH